METHPVQQSAFHGFMDAQFSSLPTWLDVVPFATELASNSEPDKVIFIDVYVTLILTLSLFTIGYLERQYESRSVKLTL